MWLKAMPCFSAHSISLPLTYWPVIHTNGERSAAPLDDLVQTADDAFSRQRKIHLDAQPLAVEVVQDTQQPELPTTFQTIRHEIHGPNQVRRIRHNQGIGFEGFVAR